MVYGGTMQATEDDDGEDESLHVFPCCCGAESRDKRALRRCWQM